MMKADKVPEEQSRMDGRLDDDLDPYPPGDPDLMSPIHGGDVCPRCGKAIAYEDWVVNLEGEEGDVNDLAPNDISEPLYHPKCLEERRAEAAGQRVSTLDEW